MKFIKFVKENKNQFKNSNCIAKFASTIGNPIGIGRWIT